jgi:hypothetical protein
MAFPPLPLLVPELGGEDEGPHATADITVAAPMISAPRLRPRFLVIGASLCRHYPDRL